MILVESAFRFSLLFEHDLFRKPVSTFRDHALMPATPDELFAYLNTLGLAHRTVTHPAVFTVEEARELRAAISGGRTKDLFLRGKKGPLYHLVGPAHATIAPRCLLR